MNEVANSRNHNTRRVAIAVVGLLLLAGAVGLVVWLSSGPSVYASGHHWALYPSTDDSPEPDSSSEQEKLAFDENVKVFSLLYTEHLTKGEGEKIREVLCHVLIDLPPKAILRVTGGGGSSDEDFDNYKTAKVIIHREGAEPLEVPFQLRFRFSDNTLNVRSGEDSGMSFVAADPGNVYIVRIGESGTLDEWQQCDELVKDELEAADVERLLATKLD